MDEANKNIPIGDMARSLLRFSWAISLLGAQQAARMLTEDGRRRAAADLDAVRHEAERQMEGPVRSLFRAGDQVQRGLVDLVTGSLGRARSCGEER